MTTPSSQPGFLRRRWQWVVGGLAVVVLLAVGAPFFYIHVIEGPAPAALTLTAAAPGTSAAAPGTPAGAPTASGAGVGPDGASTTSVDGTYVVGAGSEAGYRVNEILVGQHTTAVGRTSAVTGGMTLAGTSVSSAHFSVDMASVTSDKSQRDNQFRGRIMDVAAYPTATFVTSAPIALGSVPAAGARISATASGTLTLHGKAKQVTLTLQATRTATGVQVAGSIPVVFADYGIANPSFGPISTDDHGTVEVLLNLTKS